MKLPSMQYIVQDSRRTIGRFPLACVCALLGTVIALILVDYEGPARESILFNILFAAVLGFPLLTTIPLVVQKRSWSTLWSFGLQTIAILALVRYACTIPGNIPHAPFIYLYREMLLALALVLLAMFAPYAASGQHNGFWQFNKMLFFRLLTAALFALVLFLGLSIALAALDNLFGMDIPGRRYPELWIAITGIFGSLFFLSAIPRDLDALEAQGDYPNGLRVFAQYILAPLVLVYLIILYAYIAKIIGQWNWPQGWVSRLIIGFSATGIFALTLLYPIRERIENRWIKSAVRWFWIVIIPLILVLVLAIWRRLSDYGVTEPRYIGVVLVIWLAAMALYFNLSKTKGLKIIPASLCLLALVISFGPWGMFHVSEQSQVCRLRQLLVDNNRLVDNQVRISADTVRAEDTRQISSIIAYLHETHGYARIQPWFAENLSVDTAGVPGRRRGPAEVTKLIGIEYVFTPRYVSDRWLEFVCVRQRTLPVAGYQRLVPEQYINPNSREQKFAADGIAYRVDSSLWVMTFVAMTDSITTESLQVDLHPVIDALTAEYGPGGGVDIPPLKLSAVAAGDRLKVGVYLRRIQLERRDDILNPTYYVADILYSVGQ
ncbi:MAG: DUF4153 domain-containing protein [candidate division Zixibacteria bacterium]|nr:DUF4153 domain-containing protein [candidate division Zixibacteria bacterium]